MRRPNRISKLLVVTISHISGIRSQKYLKCFIYLSNKGWLTLQELYIYSYDFVFDFLCSLVNGTKSSFYECVNLHSGPSGPVFN